MPAVLSSSIFSFVDFNATQDACNDGRMPLPAVTGFGIKFQIKYSGVNAGITPWAAPVKDGVISAPITAAKAQFRRLCGRLSFPIPLNVFPITITSSGSLPQFNDGTYLTAQDFLDNLNGFAEFSWKKDDTHIYADSCCIPVFTGVIDVDGIAGYHLHDNVQLDWMYFYVEIPNTNMAGLVDLGECFQYGVYGQDPSADPDSGGPLSNWFKNVAPSCFLTFIEYWSLKNSFEFDYSCGEHNSVWLPIYMLAPNNPTTESVYIESTGRRRVLSASIDEEYQVKTDRLTQWLHRKIEGTLLHDFKLFTNSYYGLVAESLTKNGPYTKDWDTDVHIATAIGNTKLIKNLSQFNSGCCQVEQECCADLSCGQLTALAIETSSDDGGVWSASISAGTFTPIPTANQTIQVFYRERYSLGAYTNAGTITFSPAGVILSMPNPFVITGIADAWEAIELKLVNACGADDLVLVVYNPCEHLVGVLGTTVDEDPDWSINLTYFVYSNWPPFEAPRTISIGWREFGSVGAFTSIGSISLTVHSDYSEDTTPPFPINVTGWPGAYEKVELQFLYECGKQYKQVWSSPLGGCSAITEIRQDAITATQLDVEWDRVLPTPPDGYDWELWEADMMTMLDSGNVLAPGGVLFLTLTGLTGHHHYILRVRTVCDRGAGLFSPWTILDFTTA